MPILCMFVALPTPALARLPRSGSGGTSTGSGGTSTGGTTTTGSGGSGLGASGGGAPASPSGTGIVPAVPAPNVITLAGVISTSGDGISLTLAASGTQGQPLTIHGNAPAGDAGGLIEIQTVSAGHSDWTQVATATIVPGGGFSTSWTPASHGQLSLRALLAPRVSVDAATGSSGAGAISGSGGGSAASATGTPSTSALTIPIFKRAIATIYGPGFWGHHTACGERLTHATLGVASRTLKCGTEVAVLYQGRELTVPVIDRGPFGTHASWDLTMATANALGISETVTIGALSSAVAPAFAAGK